MEKIIGKIPRTLVFIYMMHQFYEAIMRRERLMVKAKG